MGRATVLPTITRRTRLTMLVRNLLFLRQSEFYKPTVEVPEEKHTVKLRLITVFHSWLRQVYSRGNTEFVCDDQQPYFRALGCVAIKLALFPFDCSLNVLLSNGGDKANTDNTSDVSYPLGGSRYE